MGEGGAKRRPAGAVGEPEEASGGGGLARRSPVEPAHQGAQTRLPLLY